MSTQEDKLKAIADAIREKEGSTGPIPANDFAERIRSLKGGSGGMTILGTSTVEPAFTYEVVEVV